MPRTAVRESQTVEQADSISKGGTDKTEGANETFKIEPAKWQGRLLGDQLNHITTVDFKEAKEAVCKTIPYDRNLRTILNSKGEAIGTYSKIQREGGLDDEIPGILSIHGSTYNVAYLPSWVLSEDERHLVLYGNVPHSHRGGSMAVQVVSLQENSVSDMFKCSSTTSSNPLIDENGAVWWLGYQYNARDTEMSLMKITKEGDVNVKIPIGVLWSPKIDASAHGNRFLLSAYSFGGIYPKTYLFEEKRGSDLNEISGLYNYNVWLTNHLLFSTNGRTWLIIDIESHGTHVKSGLLDSVEGLIKRCFPLPDGRVMFLYASHTSGPTMAIILDWITDTVDVFLIQCPLSFHEHIRSGVNNDGNVWVNSGDALILLTNK